MASWETTVVAGALGIAFGGATALIQTALSARAKTSEELRGLRLEAYPAIWRETALFYRDAAADLNWEDLEPPQLALRSWYFTSGGLLLRGAALLG